MYKHGFLVVLKVFVLINPFHLNIQYQFYSLTILPPPLYDLSYKQVVCQEKNGVGWDPPIKVSKGQAASGGMVEGWDPCSVGRLVVVIDVNPSHGFWTTRLMKLFGHEGKCTCRYNTHGWIVYIMLFPVVCGTSRGSSWLRRNEFLKITK
jgi:hypothetical protein